jgi:hypothetical protein
MQATLPPHLWDSTESAKTENDDPSLALRECLDKHGAFAKQEDRLEFNDYCHLRSMSVRQALRKLEADKEKIDK